MDDAETVKKDWQEKGVYGLLDELYSEIWVYGKQDFYDPISEYDIHGIHQRQNALYRVYSAQNPGQGDGPEIKKRTRG